MVLAPFDSIAGLNEDEAVWPLTTGSVSVISSVTRGRQFDGDGDAFEGLEIDLHAVGEERLLVADDVVVNGDLLVVGGLHEVVALAVIVEELVLALVDVGLLDHFDGAPAADHLHAVRHAAHVDVGHRVALAGVDVLGGENDVQVAVLLDDVAFAQRRGDDLDHYFFLVRALGGGLEERQKPGRRADFVFRRRRYRKSGKTASPERERRAACLTTRFAARLAVVDARASMPTAGRSCWLRNRIEAALRGYLAARGFRDGRSARACSARRATKRTSMPLPPTMIGNDGMGADALPPHLARILDEEAARGGRDDGSPASATCGATASAARCTIPSSRCSNGTAPASAYDAVIDDCVALIAARRRDRRCDDAALPRARGRSVRRAERISVAEAFARHAGIDLLATMAPTARPMPTRWPRRCAAPGSRCPPTTPGRISSRRVLIEKVEPNLGIGRVTILDRYPAGEAALARRTADDPRVAERFEIYACGVELANGFGELTDAGRAAPALRSPRWTRSSGSMARRYPLDEDFLAALRDHARSERRRARLRPAGDAGDRRAAIEQVLWVPVALSAEVSRAGAHRPLTLPSPPRERGF